MSSDNQICVIQRGKATKLFLSLFNETFPVRRTFVKRILVWTLCLIVYDVHTCTLTVGIKPRHVSRSNANLDSPVVTVATRSIVSWRCLRSFEYMKSKRKWKEEKYSRNGVPSFLWKTNFLRVFQVAEECCINTDHFATSLQKL